MNYDEWNRQQVAERVTAAWTKTRRSRIKRIASGTGVFLKSLLLWLGLP
jgi:hypothetical protein